MNELSSKVIAGDPRSIARLITLVENNEPDAVASMRQIHRYTGRAQIIGITGVMGSGKSSLIFELALAFRAEGKSRDNRD